MPGTLWVFGRYYFINQIRQSVSVFPYWSPVTEKSMGKNPTKCNKQVKCINYEHLVLTYFLVWASLDPNDKHVYCKRGGFFFLMHWSLQHLLFIVPLQLAALC